VNLQYPAKHLTLDKQVYVQLPMSAVNKTLPASADECRAATPLLLLSTGCAPINQ